MNHIAFLKIPKFKKRNYEAEKWKNERKYFDGTTLDLDEAAWGIWKQLPRVIVRSIKVEGKDTLKKKKIKQNIHDSKINKSNNLIFIIFNFLNNVAGI